MRFGLIFCSAFIVHHKVFLPDSTHDWSLNNNSTNIILIFNYSAGTINNNKISEMTRNYIQINSRIKNYNEYATINVYGTFYLLEDITFLIMNIHFFFKWMILLLLTYTRKFNNRVIVFRVNRFSIYKFYFC